MTKKERDKLRVMRTELVKMSDSYGEDTPTGAAYRSLATAISYAVMGTPFLVKTTSKT